MAAAIIALAACGGEDEREEPSRAAIGEARLATNGAPGDLVRDPEAQPGGVVQGEPPRSAAPPAAVGAPRRSCSGGALRPSAQNLGQVASATLCLLNVERQTRGLPALRSNRMLARAALAHSRDMVRGSYFAHNSRSGATFIDRIRRTGYFRGPVRWTVGENLAWGGGSKSSPREIVQSWMGSPGHRANILQRRFREIGIGIVLGAPSGSSRTSAATYNTAFGTRSRAA